MSAFAPNPSNRLRSHFFSERPSHPGTNRTRNQPLPRPRTHTLGRPVSPPLVNGSRPYGIGRSGRFSPWSHDRPPSFHNTASTKEQNVQAAQSNAAEDVLSTTSASSKASQASRICRHCKQTTGMSNIDPLHKCTTCHRHWHKHCGVRTYAAAERGSRGFVCDKCPAVGDGKIPTGSPAKRKAEETQTPRNDKKPRLQGPGRPALQNIIQPVSKQIVRGTPSLPQQPKAVRADEQTEARLKELFPGDGNIGVPQRWAAPVHRDPELRRCLRDVYDRAAAAGNLRSLWYEGRRHLARACEMQGYLSCTTLREVGKMLEGSSERTATQQVSKPSMLTTSKVATTSAPAIGAEASSRPSSRATECHEMQAANVVTSQPKLIGDAAVGQQGLRLRDVQHADTAPYRSVKDSMARRAPAELPPGPSEPDAAQTLADPGVLPQRPILTHQLPPRPPTPAVWQDERHALPVTFEHDRSNGLPRSPVAVATEPTRPIHSQSTDNSDHKPTTNDPLPPIGKPGALQVSTLNRQSIVTSKATAAKKPASDLAITNKNTTSRDKPDPPSRSLRPDGPVGNADPLLNTIPIAHDGPSSSKGHATKDEDPLTETIAQHDGPTSLDTPAPVLEPKELLAQNAPLSPIHGVDTPYSPAPSTQADIHFQSEPPSPMIDVRKLRAKSSGSTSVTACQPEASVAGPSMDTKPVPSKGKARRTTAGAKIRDSNALMRVNYRPTSTYRDANNGLGQSPVDAEGSGRPVRQQAPSDSPGPPLPSVAIARRASLQSIEKQPLAAGQKTASDDISVRHTEEPVVSGTSNAGRATVTSLATTVASRCFIPKPPRRPSIFQTPEPPSRGQTTRSTAKQLDSRNPCSHIPGSSASGNERQSADHQGNPQTPVQSPNTPVSQGRESPAAESNTVQASLSVVIPSGHDAGTHWAKTIPPLPAPKNYVDQACQTAGGGTAAQGAVRQPTPESIDGPDIGHNVHEVEGGRRKIDADVIAEMKAQGIMFENSDTDDPESEDESPPQRPMLTLLQTKKTSDNLYDVAPSLRRTPLPDPSAEYQPPGPRKAIWENFTAHVLEKRRQKFGNDHPHRTVERDTTERMVTTTRLQDYRTLPRLRFDDPPEMVRVQMPFSEFMDFPKDLVYAPQTGRNARKQLVFRDGAKEKRWLESGAPRRTRKGVEQAWVYKL